MIKLSANIKKKESLRLPEGFLLNIEKEEGCFF